MTDRPANWQTNRPTTDRRELKGKFNLVWTVGIIMYKGTMKYFAWIRMTVSQWVSHLVESMTVSYSVSEEEVAHRDAMHFYISKDFVITWFAEEISWWHDLHTITKYNNNNNPAVTGQFKGWWAALLCGIEILISSEVPRVLYEALIKVRREKHVEIDKGIYKDN